MDNTEGDSKQTDEEMGESHSVPSSEDTVVENKETTDKTQIDMGARARTFTEKGQSYELDKLAEGFSILKALSQNIMRMVSDKEPYDSIKGKYSLWMDKYEAFLEKHQNIMANIRPDDKEQYIAVFEERNRCLSDVKAFLENYFLAIHKERKQEILNVLNTKESKTVRSRHSSSGHSSSRHSSTSSRASISSQKIKEEQKRAELETKMKALEKRKHLELAKLRLKLEEEEFQLSTDIAISDAKYKVLNQYEDEDYIRDTCSEDGHTEQKKLTQEEELKEKTLLDVNAKPFVPSKENLKTHNLTDMPKDTSDKTDRNSSHMNMMDKSDAINSSALDSDMTSVVKHLRKPVSDIKKFGGDPLEFRKFYRQFNARIIVNSENEEEKMTYLEQFTYGEANKVVSGYGQLNAEHAFSSAMKKLQERYGDDEVIANAFIKKALDWPNIPSGDPKSLDQFALFLIECKNAVESMEAMKMLEYSENIRQLMCKLPFHLHDRWRNIVLRTKTNNQTVRFEHFVKFVEDEAKKVNDLIYGSSVVTAKRKNDPVKNFHQKRGVRQGSACAADIKTQQAKLECSYCKNPHKLENCKVLSKLEHQEKLNHLKSLALCFGCLKKGHMTKKCTNRLTCMICKRKHPTVLHYESKSETKPSTDSPSLNEESSNVQSTPEVVAQTGAGDFKSSCAMAIVPVKVKLRDKLKTIDTYAFFDTGSSVSFCTESVMRQLGGSGKHKRITLSTMGSPLTMKTYMLDGLQVCDIDMNHIIDLPTVYTKDDMPVTEAHIPTNDELSKWPHLNGIRLPEVKSGIGLMIGNNVPDAYTPFEVAAGPAGSPHATKSRLGWIIWNLVRQGDISETYSVVNRAQLASVSDIEENNKLEKLVQKSINHDFPERLIDDKRENSLEDKYFLQQVNESVTFENGHYCIDLPFKDKNIVFPNNRIQGLQRLKGLQNKMSKDSKFKDDYVTFMNNLQAKGHAEKVPESELNQDDGRVWYIPHHGVYHPMKPNKIRVVFDCSASYMGVSLNKALLQGPDLANNLLGVLMRFRSEKIPILGDIESMFYQVNVPLKDRNYLRFLWWPNGDFESKPEVYRMTVHLFGATSSPSICNFALRRTAEEYGAQYEREVSETIERNMYVDDCLVSTESDAKAIKLVDNVGNLCKKGGFNLTKWMSSSQVVVDSIPEKDRAKEMKQWDFLMPVI